MKMSEIVPIGTVLKCGTVVGVMSLTNERYYFISCNETEIAYFPSGLVEKEYELKQRSENEIQK